MAASRETGDRTTVSLGWTGVRRLSSCRTVGRDLRRQAAAKVPAADQTGDCPAPASLAPLRQTKKPPQGWLFYLAERAGVKGVPRKPASFLAPFRSSTHLCGVPRN